MNETSTDVEEPALSPEITKLDTAPDPVPDTPDAPDEFGTRQRGQRLNANSVIPLLRWAWYSLTSMRTALILLFLLALAAVPGSILPQRGGSDSFKVVTFYRSHPTLAPILDHLGLFNVFGSVWFAAIYLLLFISLAGCVLPRAKRHLASMRKPPPAAPRNLSRLPLAASWHTDVDAQAALEHAEKVLRGKRFRVVRANGGETSLGAEKGYLRETGNVLFHLSLLVLLGGIAVTSAFGFTGTALVKEHDGFSDTLIDYDTFSHGRMVDVGDLPPFSFTLDNFHATYQRGGSANGQATSFEAHVMWQPNLDAPARPTKITVNHPLQTHGTSVYLTGHGYAPEFVITDGSGRTFDTVTPFLPQEGTFDYQGVVKVPDAKPSQIGISGFFFPTASVNPATGQPISIFPDADNPAVVISIYSGDLGLDNGVPQSVYTLDTTKLKQQAVLEMTPGQTVTLPGGVGTVTFKGYAQWAAFSFTHDPGKPIVLGAVVAMVLGLVISLRVRRRRMWVRARTDEAGRTVVEAGGLTRTDASGGFDDEFAKLVESLQAGAPVSAHEASARTEEV